MLQYEGQMVWSWDGFVTESHGSEVHAVYALYLNY